MSFSHLSLVNFRNYVRLELDLPSGPVVLQGENGAGKTNFLEALYFVATTKSPRASSDRELLHWHAVAEEPVFARVAAVARRLQARPSAPPVPAAHPTRIEITLAAREPGERDVGADEAGPSLAKRIRVNGTPCRAVDLIGQVKVVVFSPLDIDLVSGAPAGRRRYLDITNAQLDRRYVRTLAQYNRVVLQRNHLLRQIRERHAGFDQLGYWDGLLAETASYIVWRRCQTIAALNRVLLELYPPLAGARSRLRVDYVATVGDLGTEPAESAKAIADLIPARLAEVRDREVALGASLIGPHRDDFGLSVDGVDMRPFGSRGQQRLVALAVKLAEAEYIEAESGDVPVLLLDDVMSELDAPRRQHVLDAVRRDQQVFLTTTEIGSLPGEFVAGASLFSVQGGVVTRS